MRIKSAVQILALGLMVVAAPAVSRAQIGIGVSIRIGPPALPVYVQPPCPFDGYLWTPGYWAYGPEGYYWVPGVWVAPPRPGLLWTPGYWGFAGGLYGWHAGYWGPHVGFYGGVNYGFGYGGVGFIGGGWAGNVFRYNTAVVNVNTTVVRNVYVDRTVIRNTTGVNRTSFNGPGGVVAQPTAEQRSWEREPHVAATANQVSHERAMSQDRRQFASVNNGRPATVAMDRPGGKQFGAQSATPAPGRGFGRAAGQNAAARPAQTQGFHPSQPAGREGQTHYQPPHYQPQAREARPQPQAHEARPQPQAHERPAPQGHPNKK